MSSGVQKKEAPSVGLPKSSETCEISVINTTTNIVAPIHFLLEPKIKGHDYVNLPTYGYHIKHKKSGKQLVFDLGSRKDWQNAVPNIAAIPTHLPGWSVEKDIVEILAEGNIKPTDIEAVILSHWHFDHSGDPTRFPDSVDFFVGPGFKEAFLPGYPDRDDSPFHKAEFDKRNTIEVAFSDDFKIGQFQAHDYFGDGSLYILNVPGHAIGHISALVRTTPDTAIFLGGDVCHFTGMLRPTNYNPMPDNLPDETALDSFIPRGCPCSAFTYCHPDQSNSRTTPFYKPSAHESSFYLDQKGAIKSINALSEFDADPNILVTIAHDPTPLDVFPFFPHRTVNDWKHKGYKQALEWGFVNELPYNGKKSERKPLVDGVFLNGKKLQTFDGEKV